MTFCLVAWVELSPNVFSRSDLKQNQSAGHASSRVDQVRLLIHLPTRRIVTSSQK